MLSKCFYGDELEQVPIEIKSITSISTYFNIQASKKAYVTIKEPHCFKSNP